MAEMVIDIQVLQNMISSRVPTKKVKFFEENSVITLTPFYDEKPRFDHLVGIFSDGKMSVDKFLEEKRYEMVLEI